VKPLLSGQVTFWSSVFAHLDLLLAHYLLLEEFLSQSRADMMVGGYGVNGITT